MRRRKKDKFVLGITGALGSGKSTVAALFKTGGCKLIDADELAHCFLARGTTVYRRVVDFFGRRILKANGSIDRGKLAKIVFRDKRALKKLNSIVHPEVKREILWRIKSSKKKFVVLDAPLIIEAGLRKKIDKLVVVTARKGQMLSRACRNLGVSKGEAALRMKSQISQEQKSRFADFIIDNSGPINKTKKQVLEIRRKLWKS